MNLPSTSTILIVDDTPRSLVLLRAILQSEGYHIVEARNGLSAIEAAIAHQPDAILLDVMMPDLNGFDVCRRLRADPTLESVPIILLTALDDRDSRLQGFEAGADDFVSKPFDSTELRTRLRAITRLNRFRRLSEQAARFELALANAPDPIAIVRETGEFIMVNARFDAMVAPTSRPATFVELMLPNDRERWPEWLATSLAGQTPLPFETRIAGANRGFAPIVEITAGRIPWEQRTVLSLNLRDITERRKLETGMQQTQRLDILRHMAGGIVHDLNNVLGSVMGYAQLMEFEKEKRDRESYITNIVTSCQHGATMLRKLLMFARGSTTTRNRIDPAEIARQVVGLTRKAFGLNYTVQLSLEDDRQPVMADETEVHQILMNLCVNARDAMPGGGAITLHVGTVELTENAPALRHPGSRPGTFTVVEVRDSGTGIPPDVMPHLFEPFFSTKEADRGTGLGLATVMLLLKQHEGFITVNNQPEAGAVFRCYFPAIAAH